MVAERVSEAILSQNAGERQRHVWASSLGKEFYLRGGLRGTKMQAISPLHKGGPCLAGSWETSHATHEMVDRGGDSAGRLERSHGAADWKVCADPGGIRRGSRVKRNQRHGGPDAKTCAH